MNGPPEGLLTGLKVLDFTQVVAGPLATGLLADFGAEVIHVEPPGKGDPARTMGPEKDGNYLWFKVSGRNKRSVTLNARVPEGQKLAKRMVQWADVVVTSLRQPTLELWGLDWETLHRDNPRIIVLQISGYGATSSLAAAPGFGKMGEARSGAVHLTGFPDGPPVHTGFSHGDTVTGLMGAFAITTALYRRETDPNFDGEWIDIALFEPLFRLIEWQVIVYDQLGWVPGRMGNQLAVAPAALVNCYLTKENGWITVTTATLRSVLNIVRVIGLDESQYATVEDQRRNGQLLDRHLARWIAERNTIEALEALRGADVVATEVFDVADIMADPTYAERGDIITVDDPDLGPIRMTGIVPRFDQHPGAVWRSGPALGEDNELVYREWMGLSEDELDVLRKEGVV